MKAQRKFGGEWSETKLSALRDYLAAYRLVLKNTPFETVYIDAFAGSGTEEDSEDGSRYRHGSPLIALQTEPPFHRFVFIDKDRGKLDRLRSEVDESGFGNRSIQYREGDANDHLLKLASENWRGQRAVAFLDPFALHVRWTTIQAIARTQAIDMWLLFPAMAVNRMLTKTGEIEDSWRQRLNITFGEDSGESAFYENEEPDLFGYEKKVKLPSPFDVLSKFVTERLKGEFAAVHDQPLVLKNSKGTPLFLLCFACGNERGAKPALTIANHIIKMQS